MPWAEMGMSCRREGLSLPPLLKRKAASSLPGPLFQAILLENNSHLRLLLATGLPLTGAVATEHIIVRSSGELSQPGFALTPSTDTESLSLLMWAASLGNVGALQMLLLAGKDASLMVTGTEIVHHEMS